MSVFSTPHLMRRGNVFYFRRALPGHLAPRFGRRELKFSLGTRDAMRARIRCRAYTSRFDALAAAVERMPNLSPDLIERLIRTYFEGLLSQAEEMVWMFRADGDVEIAAEIESAEQLRKGVQARIAAGDFKSVNGDAEKLMSSDSITPTQDGFDTLRLGILRAHAEQYRIIGAMLRGAYDESAPKDPLFAGVKSPGLPPLPGDQPPEGDALSISVVIDRYCKFKALQDWVPKTADENRRVLGWLQAHVGQSRKITDIKVDDIRDFRDLLVQMPKSFTAKTGLKGKTLSEIASLEPGGAKLGAGTLQKYFGCVRWFFRWCEDEGYLAASPARQIKVPKKSNAHEARDPFSTEQLQVLFSSPMFTGHQSPSRRSMPGKTVVRDGKFWIPLIGLFSGMRLGEIVQLVASDVRESHGVVYLDVNKDDGGQKILKTKSSKRTIPVHDELVRIGFLTHVETQRKKKPDGRLFPDILPGKNGYYSHNISKFFGRYLDQIGVTMSSLTFHSFRHNFTDALRGAKIEDSRIKALLGHADSSTTAIYGSGVPLKVLADDMAKVGYDVDLRHLYGGGTKTETVKGG